RLQVMGERFVELVGGEAEVLRNPVQVDRAEEEVVGAVARGEVLHEARIGLVEVEVRRPGGAYVAPYGFEQRHEALLGQERYLPVEALEVGGIDAVEVGDARMLVRHRER